MASDVPDFDQLPPVDGRRKGCAWGVFDRDGKKDVYGTLNFLTPDAVKAAASEVRDGTSVSLNWPLNAIKFPWPSRIAPNHRIKTLEECGMPGHGFDDEIEFNTQFSSQWDSFCHVVDEAGLAYNGAKPDKALLSVPSTEENALPTLDHWHARGGVVGRGVLIDYKRHVDETTGADFSPLDGHRITVDEIEAVAERQGVAFQPGDILIVRTGYTEALGSPTPEVFGKLAQGTLCGVHGAEETARWVWNKRFAAVAGDMHAFEAYPPLKPDGSLGDATNLVLHPWFLTEFGLPIGELWDLQALSAQCQKLGRYSFMLTSIPLNLPGLVGTPPNAIAIF